MIEGRIGADLVMRPETCGETPRESEPGVLRLKQPLQVFGTEKLRN